jgi:glycosyltransferase involved in cell wall biosynthesis
MDLADPRNSRTYVDSFYRNCNTPIVTTFHSAYGFKDWMSQALAVKSGRYGKLGIPARIAVKAWRNFINFKAFREINREKLRLSRAAICFSKYLSQAVGGGNVIYHGAEPAIYPIPSKQEARVRLSLPRDKMLAVAIGFRTIAKGWDILDKIEMPKDWMLVLNSSKGHYNTEELSLSFADRENIIDLQKGFMGDEELSLLLCASDCVMLPYRIASGSGVMFDALAHGLPFVASNLASFKEFAGLGLGLTVKKRNPRAFSDAIQKLGHDYDSYSARVDVFRKHITWSHVARQHIELYEGAIRDSNKE